MRVLGYFAGQFIGAVRALPCLIVERMLLHPYPDGRLFSSKWVGRMQYASLDVPNKGTEVGVGFGCRVRFWDCGGGGGDVTGPYFGLPRGGDCQYGRYFELLRGGD